MQSDNILQLYDNLAQQEENNALHKQYLELQIQRAEVALHGEQLRTQLAEFEIQKATELKNIEMNKQKSLAKMEIEAKRRELNLPIGFDVDDILF